MIRWDDFRRHVGALRERIAERPEGPWVLLTQDAYAFAVGLFALWHSGRHAVSPPNRQPGALRTLQTRAAGVLCDHPEWLPEGSCIDPLAASSTGTPPTLPALRSDALAVELFTSGTTGTEKAVVKRIRHLDDEVRALGSLWDARLGDAWVFATASHQHLYGLLFGVLWPLASGRTLRTDHLLHASELLPRLGQSEAFALVSVPTHLKRLAGHRELGSLRDRCRAVFSSGGPLPASTAHRIAYSLGAAPLEVLGSTETGGIAWRAQAPERPTAAWAPLPSVHVARDPETGVARVHSPFLSTGDTLGFATADQIALNPDGSFDLQGRADRVVKVGEKRLDLELMESQLRGHPLVAEVALTVVQLESEPRVAAAVVPTDEGWEKIAESGSRAFARSLASHLAPDWDPVLHPRLWRSVQRLPENAQGKIAAAELRHLFLDALAVAQGERPEVLERSGEAEEREWSCRVPADLACFAGHFPGSPVVPAALQLDWALALGAEILGRPPRVAEIETLKLHAPLGPGDRFRIRVRRCPGDRLELRIWDDQKEHARGRVRLAAPGRKA